MVRLIEIQAAQGLPSSLEVRAGDLLVFAASGGHVHSGAESVELLGAFLKSVLGDNRQVLSPLGAPNAVVFLARRSGSAKIDVITSAPWHGPRTVLLLVTVKE